VDSWRIATVGVAPETIERVRTGRRPRWPVRAPRAAAARERPARDGTDDLELAAQEFDHAPHIDAQLVAARASRAAPAQATGDPDAAIEDLTVAIELDAGNPDLLYNRGFVDHSAGRFREAIDDCSRALVLPDADETELLRRRTMCEVIGNRAGRACQPWNAGTVRSASSA
jgi:tetratricopeptide (TPR) repeat protein